MAADVRCSCSRPLLSYPSCRCPTYPTAQNAYRSAHGANLAPEIWSLLWAASSSPEYRARLCAVEWACDLFDFSNVAARRLCVSLCDDKVTAVRNAAARGLEPVGGGARPSSKHPTFESFVLGALRDGAMLGTRTVEGMADAGASIHELPPTVLARALNFAMECRRTRAGRGGGSGGDRVEDDEAVAVFLSLIEKTLMSAPSATDGQHGHSQMVLLHRSAAVALKKLTAGDIGDAVDSHADTEGNRATNEKFAARAMPSVSGVAARFASRGPWLQQWLGHEGSTEIREAFAETTGAASQFMDPDAEMVPLLRALVHKLKVCKLTYVSLTLRDHNHGRIQSAGLRLALVWRFRRVVTYDWHLRFRFCGGGKVVAL